MDYALPVAATIPALELHHVEEPADNLLGVRGVGEGGTLGPSAVIANAVADALAPLDVEPNDLPLAPARLWALVRERATPRSP
jgi:carbon-monoxide dehydrogenase large subunit